MVISGSDHDLRVVQKLLVFADTIFSMVRQITIWQIWAEIWSKPANSKNA
jgi:hypothetical protein